MFVSVCVCLCLSVCLCTRQKKIKFQSTWNLENIVVHHVYENSSDKFDIGHCPIKVKVIV